MDTAKDKQIRSLLTKLYQAFNFFFSLIGLVMGLTFMGGAIYFIYNFIIPAYAKIQNEHGGGGSSLSAFISITAFVSFFLIIGIIIFISALRQMSRPPKDAMDLQNFSKIKQLPKKIKVKNLFEKVIKPDGVIHYSSQNIYNILSWVVGSIGLFWNGIICLGLFDMNHGWHLSSLFSLIFMIPFLLVGLALIAGFFYCRIAAKHPICEINIHTHPLKLGETKELSWLLKGNIHRLKQLTITLTGEERFHSHGSAQKTKTNRFYSKELLNKNLNSSLPGGKLEMIIPDQYPGSGTSIERSIIWQLKIHGQSKGWVDLYLSFPLEIEENSDL